MSLHCWGSNGFGPEKTNPFKVLKNKTRQTIIIRLYKRPMTVTQLAQHFELSQPAVFGHIQTLLNAGLVKEVDLPEDQKRYKGEKYYIPGFPIISEEDKKIMEPICKKIGEETTSVYQRHKSELLDALQNTSLSKAGFTFKDLWGWIRVLAFMPVLSMEKERPPQWPSGARFYFYGEIRKDAREPIADQSDDYSTL